MGCGSIWIEFGYWIVRPVDAYTFLHILVTVTVLSQLFNRILLV